MKTKSDSLSADPVKWIGLSLATFIFGFILTTISTLYVGLKYSGEKVHIDPRVYPEAFDILRYWRPTGDPGEDTNIRFLIMEDRVNRVSISGMRYALEAALCTIDCLLEKLPNAWFCLVASLCTLVSLSTSAWGAYLATSPVCSRSLRST